MFSRFWYFLVAALAGAGIFVALAAQARINANHEAQLEEQLRRDRTEIELWLRYDARARLDAIAPVAAHRDVRTQLQRASGRRDRSTVDADIRTELGEALQMLNNQLQESAADLLLALDRGGEIIAQLGGEAPPAGAGLGQFPLVQRTLSGYVGDDVWVYNDEVYRVAARPVIDSGQYVGAIIHCSKVDQTLAERLASRLPGASLGFFMRERMVASHSATVPNAPGSQVMEGALAAHLESLDDEASPPVALGDHAQGVLRLVTGSARHAQVGYVIGRPAKYLDSPMALFTQGAVDALGGTQMLLVGGLPLLLGLLGIFWVFLERDRPFRKFRRAVDALARGEVQRLDETSLGGKYRELATHINLGIDRAMQAGGAAAPRKSADLDQILGDGEGQGSSPSFFGFQEQEKKEDEAVPSFASDPPPPAAAPPTPAAPPAAPVAPAAPAAPARPPAGPPAAPAGPPPMAPPAGPPKATPPTPALPLADDEDEDGATMVAQVPQELLEAAAERDEEERHFKEVFEKFVKLKEECGEPTAGLTYEKFRGTLRKNRDAIVSKHGAKGVRFTVYKKGGKAALKATPIKG